MHGTSTFHSIFSLFRYVSIVDLALFCLDTKKCPRQRHPIGKKKSRQKDAPPAPIAIGAPPPFCRASALEFQDKYSPRDLVSNDRLLFLIQCNLSCTPRVARSHGFKIPIYSFRNPAFKILSSFPPQFLFDFRSINGITLVVACTVFHKRDLGLIRFSIRQWFL